jgi:hypothetical protein
MSVAPVHRGRRLVATALARAESWLLEPVDAVSGPARIELRPVVAVVGLGPGCGTTTVARALGVELASRDAAGAAAVTGSLRAGAVGLATPSAGRLARAIGTAGGRRLRTTGRLCLVEDAPESALAELLRPLAPLVLDVGDGQAAGLAAALSDHLVLVATPAVEPSLATVVSTSISRIGPLPLLVLNRVDERLVSGVREPDPWEGREAIHLAESRGGARLALTGRHPRGALGPGLDQLGEACALPRSDW